MTSEQITVTVKFFAGLREFGPKKEEVKLPKNSSIKDVLDKFKVPEEKRNVVLLINSRPHKKIEDTLQNGDVLAIFPPIAGG
ncbi:MAG: MoaD/ThiS family protein [Candidatus Heimdallarchaeota archaeon]|nr:MoaD/ThiS family protein [Candidatus Heimdallarchaeota archaeon]